MHQDVLPRAIYPRNNNPSEVGIRLFKWTILKFHSSLSSVECRKLFAIAI